MVKIEITIPPQALVALTETLQDIGCKGITVTEVRSDVVRGGAAIRYRGQGFIVSLAPAVRVEVVIPGRRLEEALDVLERTAAESGAEGRILVIPVDNVVRIRTGETGEDAVGE